MKFVSIEAASEIFEKLMDVETGQTVMLMRDGIAVAKLIPYAAKSANNADSSPSS